jgi:DNA gyrase subunit A
VENVVDEDGNVIDSGIERIKPDLEVLEDDGIADDDEDDDSEEEFEDEDDTDEEESEE